MMLNRSKVVEVMMPFCDIESSNKAFMMPYIQGDYAFATDGYAMIYIDKSLIYNKFDSTSLIDMKAVIVDYSELEAMPIHVKKMIRYINELAPITKNYITSYVDCPTCLLLIPKENCFTCEGEGKVEVRTYSDKNTFDPDTCFHDGSAMFSYSHIQRVLKAAKLLKIKRILMKHDGKYDSRYYFEVGDFRIVMAPITGGKKVINSAIKFNF